MQHAGALDLLTAARRARNSARHRRARQRPIRKGGAQCSSMSEPINFCPAACRRNSSFTRNSAIRCSCAIWASRFVYARGRKRRAEHLHHVWVYESAADREAKRAQMAKDPDWKVYLGRERQGRPRRRAAQLLDDAGRLRAADPDAEDPSQVTRQASLAGLVWPDVALRRTRGSHASNDGTRTGGEILIDQLALHGVRHAFCVPGESYLAALDAFYDRDDQAHRLPPRKRRRHAWRKRSARRPAGPASASSRAGPAPPMPRPASISPGKIPRR